METFTAGQIVTSKATGMRYVVCEDDGRTEVKVFTSSTNVLRLDRDLLEKPDARTKATEWNSVRRIKDSLARINERQGK